MSRIRHAYITLIALLCFCIGTILFATGTGEPDVLGSDLRVYGCHTPGVWT